MNRKPYAYADIQRIIRLRLAGWHPRDIAGIMERPLPAINRLLSIEKHKNQYAYPPLERSNLKWTHSRIEIEIARLYPSKTYKAIGTEKGLSAPRVCALMARRAHGLQDGSWRG